MTPRHPMHPGQVRTEAEGVALATTDREIAACYPVLRELRPHIAEAEFLPRVRAQMAAGYRLAYLLADDGAVAAVAGFRIGENLAWGRFLYVDDLVTLAARRSAGHGARLLAWLRRHGAGEGCGQLHLDSGVQRIDAHRFYAREGMARTSFHFAVGLAGKESAP